jgi:hypothetical protein
MMWKCVFYIFFSFFKVREFPQKLKKKSYPDKIYLRCEIDSCYADCRGRIFHSCLFRYVPENETSDTISALILDQSAKWLQGVQPKSDEVTDFICCILFERLRISCTYCYEEKIRTKSKCLELNVNGCAQNATQVMELCSANNCTYFLKTLVSIFFLLCSSLIKRANFMKT